MSGDGSRPQEIEIKDFFYKQMRKLRVFNSPQELITARSSLVAVSNLYGIVYVAGDNHCVKAIKIETVEKLFIEVQGSLQVEEVNFLSTSVDVGCPFSQIALSCDELTLGVGFEHGGTCLLGFIDVRAFFSMKSPKRLFSEVVISSGNADIKVRQILWNPGFVDTVAVLLTDGQILMVKLNGTVATVAASLQASATAVSWSPKGKQIVAGLVNGALVQLTHDLQKKREIPSPTVLQNPSQVSDLVWISTYQFGAVYTECDDSDVSSLIIVNSPKNGPASFDMFDEAYYGIGEDREACFYLNYLAEWRLVLSIYSGAFEVVTVHQSDEGPWVKWTPIDSGQAILPTTHNNEETFPLGMAVTFAVTKPLEQDDQKFPPAPIVFVLTTDGVLCPFYMVSKNPKLSQEICHPPQQLTLDGERLAPSTTSGVAKVAGGFAAQATQIAPPAITTVASTMIPVTKPPATINTPATATKLYLPPDNTKAPITHFGSSLPTGAPPNTAPLTFGSKSVGGNFPGFSNPGTISFSPVSLPPSTIPGQTGITQFSAPHTAASGQPNSGLTYTLPKSGPISFLSSTASAKSPAQPSGLGMPKPNEPSPREPIRTETISKPSVPPTAKAPNMGGVPPIRASPLTTVRPTPPVQPIPNQGTALGNKKNGGDPSTGEPKEKPQSKLPSKLEQLEASFHKHIHEEVATFNKEMEDARNRYNELKELDVILRELNSQRISQQVNGDRRFMNQVKSTVEGLKDDVGRAKSSLLDAFELLEDAKTRDNTATDPRYLQLLKNRGLDPSSERKMKEIHSSYLLLDNTLREVNMALDEQWDKENKQKRALQSPSLDTIYQAMRQNQNIVKNQSLQLEAISNRVNSGSQKSNRWDRKGSGLMSESDDALSLSERLRKQKLNASTKVSDNVSARKKSELRHMLSKRSTVPVRKTTFISDWRTRKDSSAGSVEPENSSEADETSAKDEKPPLLGTTSLRSDGQKYPGKQGQFSFLKASLPSEQAKPVVHSTPKFGNGTSDFSFSMGFKPSSSLGDIAEKKPLVSKTAVPRENLSQISKERPVQPTQVMPTANKVGLPAGLDKLSTAVPPREAAAAAALARASVGGSKLDLGAAIPAKTLVEHKAKDGDRNVTGKDPHADQQARLIADAAVKDAEKKMKNVTQPPPSNTASTFTVRSSSSAGQSSGPPVMVLQPGGGFAARKPGGNPVLPAGKLVPQPETKTQGVSTLEKYTTSQSTGFSFSPSLGNPSFGAQPVFGGISAGGGGISVGGGGISAGGVFDTDSKVSGNTGPLSFGSNNKNQSTSSVVPSPSREEGAGGGGKQDDVAKSSKSTLSSQAASGKENVARNLFDKTSLDDDEAAIVPERGEPEGESKQPVAVVTAQRQAAIGKSDKDISKASNVTTGTKGLPPPKTSSPSNTTASKPFMAGFNSPFSTGPFVFGNGDSTLSFGGTPPATTKYSTQTTTSSQPVAKETAEPSPQDLTPSVTKSASQPAQRLEALGSRLTSTPPPFSGFNTGGPSIANTPPQTTTPSFAAPPTVQTSANVPSTAGVSETKPPVIFGSAPTTVTLATATATTTSTFGSPVIKPTFGSAPKAPSDLNSATEINPKSTREVTISPNVVTTTTTATILQPAQPASSPSPFTFGEGFGGNPATTTSAPAMFGTSTLGSTAPSFQGTQPAFGSSSFGNTSQTTGFGMGNVNTENETKPASGFGGGLSGLGGKPIEPNRNPFGVNPSSQTSDSSLFGTAAVSSGPNPFQSPGSNPVFGSTGFGASSGNTSTGVGTAGFGTASAAAPSFGSPPSFGTNPSFGANPTFGSNPTFGAAPAFGSGANFGSSPSFGGAPAFGSSGATFGGSPSFGNTGNSQSRVFGAGTETAGLFSSNPSSSPTFGSLSSQSTMSSFGGIAGGQNTTGMNPAPGFNSSMSGSSFSSYR